MVETLISGAAAFALLGLESVAPTPYLLMGIALGLCLFAPYSRSAAPPPRAPRFLGQWLPSLGVIVVTALVARFVFGENLAFTRLAPIWAAFLVGLEVLLAPRFWAFLRALITTTTQLAPWLEKPRAVVIHLATDNSCALALIAWVVLWLASRCDPGVVPVPWLAGGGALLWLALDQIPLRRWQDSPRVVGRLACVGARFVVWAVLLAGFAGPKLCPWLFDIAMLFAIYVSLRTICRIDFWENLRWIIIGCYSLYLMAPLAAPYLEGNGDSVWYGMTMADVLTQSRHGVFPIFIGQSIFQFNGNYSPLRLAPLFHHLGILADLLTWGRLDPAAIQSLVLVGCGVAGGLSAYLALRIILVHRRWLALLLACFYLASPGIIAVMYDERLYMTWTVMPWIPIALLGFVQTFQSSGWRPYFVLVLGLAFVWWGHSPVALWFTGALFFGQCFRLWRDRANSRAWYYSFAAAGLLLATVAYPIVSVLFVPADANQAGIAFYPFYKQIAEVITNAFRDSLLPVLKKERSMSDFQFGWPLLVFLLGTFVLAIRKGGWVLWSLLAQILFLFLFILPVPGLMVFCWGLVPAFVLGPTGDWALPRLYPIAISLVIFAAAVAGAFVGKKSFRWVYVVAVLGIAWSTLEVQKFMQLGEYAFTMGKTDKSPLYPENVSLSRYSYTMFGIQPTTIPYFSHGVVDPALEQRLFAEDKTTLIAANTSSILSAGGSAPGIKVLGSGDIVLNLFDPDSNRIWEFSRHFTVVPGHHYLLEMKFARPATTGLLTLKGSRLQRVYQLPEYGGHEAFGAAPSSSAGLPLWTTAKSPEDVRIQFVTPEPTTAEALNPLGKYRWIEYSEDTLPVQVQGWLPYTAKVRSPQAGWLETPKIYLQDYAATVDGRVAQVAKSQHGLAMIQVPQGESRVRLYFAAPLKLTASYLFSLVSILAIFLVCVGGWLRRKVA